MASLTLNSNRQGSVVDGEARAEGGNATGTGLGGAARVVIAVSGQIDSHALVVMGGSLVSLPDPIAPSAGLEAFSYVIAGSGDSDEASANVQARPDAPLVPSVIGHRRMGAGYGGAASGVRSYSASAVFTLTQEVRSELVLGMLDFTANGRGDDLTLRFSVTHFGTTLLEHSFSDLSAAESWFADQTLHLGTFEGETEIGLHLTLTGDFAQSADFSYMLSAPVPEPTSAALMLAGIALLRFMARWRSAQQSTPDPEDWTS